MEHIDLLALADFNLVARHESLGAAARATGRPKATLSRKIAELEDSLSLRLFERGPRGLTLTQEGHALYARTGTLLAEIAESASAIASGSERPRGRLRITAPALFSQIAMGKLISTFARKYPEVRLEVTTEDRSVDMLAEGYDVAIRVNPDRDEDLIGRIFVRDRLVVVAAPGLHRPRKADRPVPAIVRQESEQRSGWALTTRAGQVRLPITPVAVLSSLFLIRDAVRLGMGAACLPLSMVSADLASGALSRWGDIEGTEVTLWALYPSRRHLSIRVSAFLDHLKEAFPSGTPEELAAYIRTSSPIAPMTPIA